MKQYHHMEQNTKKRIRQIAMSLNTGRQYPSEYAPAYSSTQLYFQSTGDAYLDSLKKKYSQYRNIINNTACAHPIMTQNNIGTAALPQQIIKQEMEENTAAVSKNQVSPISIPIKKQQIIPSPDNIIIIQSDQQDLQTFPTKNNPKIKQYKKINTQLKDLSQIRKEIKRYLPAHLHKWANQFKNSQLDQLYKEIVQDRRYFLKKEQKYAQLTLLDQMDVQPFMPDYYQLSDQRTKLQVVDLVSSSQDQPHTSYGTSNHSNLNTVSMSISNSMQNKQSSSRSVKMSTNRGRFLIQKTQVLQQKQKQKKKQRINRNSYRNKTRPKKITIYNQFSYYSQVSSSNSQSYSLKSQYKDLLQTQKLKQQLISTINNTLMQCNQLDKTLIKCQVTKDSISQQNTPPNVKQFKVVIENFDPKKKVSKD